MNGISQAENRLVHPLFSDVFKSYHLLPDGTIRVIMVSDQNNGYGEHYPIYMDIQAGSLFDLPEPVRLEIPEHWFNNYTNEFFSIGLVGGDIIMGNTQFDCDYEPPGGLMRLDRDGNIRWFIDFIEAGIYFPINGLIFIDENSILVKDYWEPQAGMIIDRDGNILNQPIPDVVYDRTIETDFGFLASINQRLDVLDTNFNVSLSYELGNTIENILVLGPDRYLIQLDNKSFIFNEEQLLEELPISPAQFKIIGYTQSYWAIQDNKQIIRLDTFFTPLDTFKFAPGVQPMIFLPVNDGVACISKYRSNSTLLFKGEEEEINFSLPQDIGITGIYMPDTIYFRPPSNHQNGLEFTIDSLYVDITNFGMDTISQFTVSLPKFWSCYRCEDGTAFWYVDTLVLAPGQTVNVFLGNYFSDCLAIGGPSWRVCLSTMAPNSRADGNFLNDTMCHRFPLVYTSTQNIYPELSVTLKPVPAGDFILIQMEEYNNKKLFGSIYDVSGKRIHHFEFSSKEEIISTENLDSGLYFLHIYDTSGLRTTKKYLVQH